MKIKLSVTDQSPVHGPQGPQQAPQLSTRLAQQCDAWGYERFWIAEHHNTGNFASPCPEILIAHIAGQTQGIRVGSGGVMLSHYSPYKVAEQFHLLSALHPGRIDLGIGRAPGGDALASEALSFPHRPNGSDYYPQLAADLAGFIRGNLDPRHPYNGLKITTAGGIAPELWMLGSGSGSSELAGHLGMGFVLALFIGLNERSAEIFELYRKAYRRAGHAGEPRSMLAVAAICAPTREEARLIGSSHAFRKVQTNLQGIRGDILSPQEVMDLLPGLSPSERGFYDATLDHLICGTPEQCREQIEQLAQQYDTDEISVVNVTYAFEDRLRSYELLAQAFELTPR